MESTGSPIEGLHLRTSTHRTDFDSMAASVSEVSVDHTQSPEGLVRRIFNWKGMRIFGSTSKPSGSIGVASSSKGSLSS